MKGLAVYKHLVPTELVSEAEQQTRRGRVPNKII